MQYTHKDLHSTDFIYTKEDNDTYRIFKNRHSSVVGKVSLEGLIIEMEKDLAYKKLELANKILEEYAEEIENYS